ncbi:hypothetical protein J1N35_005444 [Gossypium stocksii]|uniref:Uncharacterized protein n=1 Tax=Gossypium stocksii TaxID=47602 RepID=A0A9D4AIL7_9ROSI|nr:hypothetical protein J1N35_005444 [Gossypium stocksii]
MGGPVRGFALNTNRSRDSVRREDMMLFIIKHLQRTYKAKTPLEEVVHDVSDIDPKDQCITNNHSELNLESQQHFETGDGDKLNIVKDISDPIHIVVDVELELEVEELQTILNESVNRPIHFLAITNEVPTKKTGKFVSFSFGDEGKTRAIKASRNMEGEEA